VKPHRDPLNEAIARAIQNAQVKSRNTSASVRPQRRRRRPVAAATIPNLPPPAVIHYQPLAPDPFGMMRQG
jgi:hypothetical protein